MKYLVLSLASVVLFATPSALWADAFDNYTNAILVKVPMAAGAMPVKQLSPALLTEHGGVLPGTTAALVVVKTNEGRMSKLLVQPARQKVRDKTTLPIALIDRFVTYREGEEREILVQGQNVRLFDGFQFSLDLGQVVPASVGGDLRVVADKGKVTLEPVGKAALYLLTKRLSEATPKKTQKVAIGQKFEARYFDGVYKLFDDGRRSGALHLKVLPGGEVEGSYYSDKDGKKYEVAGKVGLVPHAIEFTILFPRVRQVFTGWMFTGDGRAIAGSSRLQDRALGFYALRIEEEK